MRRRAVGAVLLCLALPGCGTLASMIIDGGGGRFVPNTPPFGPYSGVRTDVRALRSHGAEHQPWVIPFVLLDLPLSFALDTALLPFSGLRWAARALSDFRVDDGRP